MKKIISKYKTGFLIVIGIVCNMVLSKATAFVDYRKVKQKNYNKYQDEAVIVIKKMDIPQKIDLQTSATTSASEK